MEIKALRLGDVTVAPGQVEVEGAHGGASRPAPTSMFLPIGEIRAAAVA